jgi:hypothetical protein
LCAQAIVLLAAGGVAVADGPGNDLTDSPSLHVLLGGNGPLPGGATEDHYTAGAFQLIYEQPRLLGPLGLDVVYLNEGFLPQGRRDDFGLQLSYWTPMLLRCRLGAQAGADIYSNTTYTNYYERATDYYNRHGGGLLLSAAAQCRITEHVGLEYRVTQIHDDASFATRMTMLGLEYTPGTEDSDSTLAEGGEANRSYVELAIGRTVVDTFYSSLDRGVGWTAGFGLDFSSHMGLELSAIDEGRTPIANRCGAAVEFKVRQEFSAGRWELFVGTGPYLARLIEIPAGTGTTRTDLLIDYGARWELTQRIALSIKGIRVLSSTEHDDADLIELGTTIRLL